MERILLIEDDASILKGLTLNLRFEGYQVQVAEDGERGLEMAIQSPVSLIILDLMLPRMNGYEVLRNLRNKGIQTPVIMLTAKGTELDKILGLDLGADDYVTKPFGLKELLARIKAVLRRHKRADIPSQEILRFGDVEVNLTAREVSRGGQPVPLSFKELELLRYFLRQTGQALPRERILLAVWGADYEGTERTVDNFIQKLREKLDDPENPRHFQTVRGVGYRFDR